MKQPPSTRAAASGLKIILLRARFNDRVVDGLLAGAREALADAGARPEDVTVVDVPGAFELPLAARAAARSKGCDAVVALGAVIRGETDHYEHIAREAASGLAAVARKAAVPVGFGVLTVAEEAQALARSAPGPENKGAEAARAAVAMVHVLRSLEGKKTTETQRHREGKKEEGQRKGQRRRRSRGSNPPKSAARNARKER